MRLIEINKIAEASEKISALVRTAMSVKNQITSPTCLIQIFFIKKRGSTEN